MIGDDPRELGPAAPPYFCERSPAVFMAPNDHISIHTLASYQDSGGHRILLTILRAVAWADASKVNADRSLADEPVWWDEIAQEASGLGIDAYWLIVELISSPCLEWGVSLRTGWLTDEGWRALWAHELALEMALEEEA